MPLQLPSKRPEFGGFGTFYDAEIEPYLRQRDQQRRAAVFNFLVLTVSLIGLAILVAMLGPFGTGNIHVAFFIGMAGAAAATWILNRARKDIAEGLLSRISGRLGFDYRQSPGRPMHYADYREFGLLPNHNREAWEDEVKGAYHGAALSLCEAHLKYKSSGKNSSTRTVFHGQLIVLDYPKKFLGTTVIRRDAGVFNRFTKPGSGFSHVGLASAKFEKAFEAWSTDQVEARDLLDPIVLERFQALEKLFDGKKFRAAFTKGNLLIAIETGDRLQMGSMFKPLVSKERVETILAEFNVIFDLIDVLLKRADGRLNEEFSISHVRQGG